MAEAAARDAGAHPRRRVTALALIVLAVGAAVVAVAVALSRAHTTTAPTTTALLPLPPKPSASSSGRLHARHDGRPRPGGGTDRRAQRGKPVALARASYVQRRRRSFVPCFAPRKRTKVEGFLFPATTTSSQRRRRRQLVTQQVKAFCTNWKTVNLSYARPRTYAVRRPDDRVTHPG